MFPFDIQTVAYGIKFFYESANSKKSLRKSVFFVSRSCNLLKSTHGIYFTNWCSKGIGIPLVNRIPFVNIRTEH